MAETDELGDLLRILAPQVLGMLVRGRTNFADAEDAVQEALLAASVQWPTEGVPENPRGWLVRVANRRLVDRIRSEVARRQREEASAMPEAVVDSEPARDDSVMLLFLCCHPELPPASAIALTLRAVAGLTTAEIARAFLVPEATMAQRVSRAKQRITQSGLPFRLPTRTEWDERLRAVLHVLYLLFNEGYASTSGQTVMRTDLSAEAIRLTRALHRELPGDADVRGLLALMLLTDARSPARTAADGTLVAMAEQDRSLWDMALISEGLTLLGAAERRQRGEYEVQAAIAAAHATARDVAGTDWRHIETLYAELERATGNPMVTLNRAVAVAMVDGPAAGMAVLDSLGERLGSSHRARAVRGHLLHMAGDTERAKREFVAAAATTTSTAERVYLLRMADGAHASPDDPNTVPSATND